jgi:hypothetical protein
MPNLLEQTYAVVLKQLEEMPEFLRLSLSGLPPELMSRKPLGDDLSLVEHLCHVHDCDPDLYALRIRRILREASPFLEPVNVSVWPQERQYASKNPASVLADFIQIRSELVEELRGLREAELSRVGKRADGTEINVLGVVAQIAEHDWDHKRRVAAILREFSSNAAGA